LYQPTRDIIFVMGPCVLFDKSFLQSLSLDEAVLFDNFFLCNIAPLFFERLRGQTTKKNS